MTKSLTDLYAEDGYLHLRSYFDLFALGEFEDQIIALYAMQARKIGEYRDAVDTLMASGATRFEEMSGIVNLLEGSDKEALYQAQKFLPSCQALRSLFRQEFIEFCAKLIGGNPGTMLLDGPALFVNKPGVKRLLYRWHSEANYYGKRRRFANIWLPVFDNRSQENGTMAVMPRSHKRVWDASQMVEYSGFDAGDEKKRNQFTQLEIPANFLSAYTAHHCESNRGDVLIFDRNTVHTSNPNLSDKVSFAIVCRVWDPSDDLTLSGNMECQPYGGNIGRAGLVVTP